MQTMFTNKVISGTRSGKKCSKGGHDSRHKRPKLFRRQKLFEFFHYLK